MVLKIKMPIYGSDYFFQPIKHSTGYLQYLWNKITGHMRCTIY